MESPQIAVTKNAAGLLSLSFELRNKDDDVLVKMEDNWFTAYPSNVHDMIVTPKSKEVKVWLSDQDVGLEFSFRRITSGELDAMLATDRQRAEPRGGELLARMAPEQRAAVEAYTSKPRRLPPWVDELPDKVRELYLAEDTIGYAVRRWVKENCLADDGLVPLLNFEQMSLYFHGTRINIKDGIGDLFYYNAFFGSTQGAINLSV